MSLDIYLIDNKCECCGSGEYVYETNITHNLNRMAVAVGIYEILWCPVENDIKCASDIIATLSAGIHDLKLTPEKYKQYDAPNGWGTYDDFLPWLDKYLEACKNYPNAVIKISK